MLLLVDTKLFEAFIDEFASENILFSIYLIQFENCLMDINYLNIYMQTRSER